MSKTTIKGIKGREQLYHAVYDFSVDSGTAATPIDLFTLSANSIVHDFWLEVETLCTSGGAATLEVGVTGGDTDGVIAQAAVATFAADFVSSDQEKGALLWDDTNDHGIRKKFTTETDLSLLIGTADLTAGKIHFYAKVSDGY